MADPGTRSQGFFETAGKERGRKFSVFKGLQSLYRRRFKEFEDAPARRPPLLIMLELNKEGSIAILLRLACRIIAAFFKQPLQTDTLESSKNTKLSPGPIVLSLMENTHMKNVDMNKPKVFIGSSKEDMPLATAMLDELQRVCLPAVCSERKTKTALSVKGRHPARNRQTRHGFRIFFCLSRVFLT